MLRFLHVLLKDVDFLSICFFRITILFYEGYKKQAVNDSITVI